MNIDPITTPRKDNAIGFSSTPIQGHKPPPPSLPPPLFSRVIASLYYIMTWLMPWKYFSHKGVGPQRSFQSTPNPPCKPSFMRQCLNRVHKFTGCM